jgi:hypothetical protein
MKLNCINDTVAYYVNSQMNFLIDVPIHSSCYAQHLLLVPDNKLENIGADF